ncbi:hypothetical protein NQZ79_g3301 [Umbelopsis isabellina]|nr:hypothetical protein NQZ79_g3301 [Umbelopsis isabellina]
MIVLASERVIGSGILQKWTLRTLCLALTSSTYLLTMAVFLPLLVIGGAPVCYATYKVFETVDKETTHLLASNEKEQAGPTSIFTAAAVSTASIGILSKYTFTPQTRHRLFFAKVAPSADLRVASIKVAGELLARLTIVLCGAAAAGSASGRAVAMKTSRHNQ